MLHRLCGHFGPSLALQSSRESHCYGKLRGPFIWVYRVLALGLRVQVLGFRVWGLEGVRDHATTSSIAGKRFRV